MHIARRVDAKLLNIGALRSRLNVALGKPSLIKSEPSATAAAQSMTSHEKPGLVRAASEKLLVLGATSLLNVVGKRQGALRDWIVGLLAKKPARLVTVALANRLARILWAMMKTGESFRA